MLGTGQRAIRKRCAKAQRRRGGVLVEFAIVLPVLITMTMGMLELGRGYMVANGLTMAAREGARAGAVANADNTKITTAISTSLANQGISTANLTTTIKVNGTVANASTAVTGNTITVTLTLPYNDVSWVGVGKYLGGKNLSAYVAMRRE